MALRPLVPAARIYQGNIAILTAERTDASGFRGISFRCGAWERASASSQQARRRWHHGQTSDRLNVQIASGGVFSMPTPDAVLLV